MLAVCQGGMRFRLFAKSTCRILRRRAFGRRISLLPHARCMSRRHALQAFCQIHMPHPSPQSIRPADFFISACSPSEPKACGAPQASFPHARRDASQHAVCKFSLPYMPIVLNKSIRIGQAPDALCFSMLFYAFTWFSMLFMFLLAHFYLGYFIYAFKFCALRLTAPNSGAAASFVCNPAMCLRPALIENEHQRSLRLVPLLEDVIAERRCRVHTNLPQRRTAR